MKNSQKNSLFCLIVTITLFTSQDLREQEIEKALKEFTDDDVSVRDAAVRKLIDYEAKKECKALESSDDPEIKVRAKKVVMIVRFIHEFDIKDVWKKAPFLVENLSTAEKTDWPGIIGKALQSNAEIIDNVQKSNLAKKLLKERIIVERLNGIDTSKKAAQEEAWFYLEALGDDRVHAGACRALGYVVKKMGEKPLDNVIKTLLSRLESKDEVVRYNTPEALENCLRSITNEEILAYTVDKLCELEKKQSQDREDFLKALNHIAGRLKVELKANFVKEVKNRFNGRGLALNNLTTHALVRLTPFVKNKKLEQLVRSLILRLEDRDIRITRMIVSTLAELSWKFEKDLSQEVAMSMLTLIRNNHKARNTAVFALGKLAKSLEKKIIDDAISEVEKCLSNENKKEYSAKTWDRILELYETALSALKERKKEIEK